MENPFVVCHMFTSLDGKISGRFMTDPAASPALAQYGALREEYDCEAVLYGTVTMAEGFADGWLKEPPKTKAQYAKEDLAAPHGQTHYIISVDPKGQLAWHSPVVEKKGRPAAHVIEVLTGQATQDYVGYLKEMGISYLFAGEEQLDCPLMLHKLKTQFGIEKVLLAGGGYMNGSLLQHNLIDELSLVIAPVVEGNTASASCFAWYDTAFASNPAAFSFLAAKRLEGNGLWLRYTRTGDKQRQESK